MKKEDYHRIDDKLDEQTKMLMSIQNDLSKEISLIKLAHQKLKYMTFSVAVVLMLKLYIDYPKLTIFFTKIL